MEVTENLAKLLGKEHFSRQLQPRLVGGHCCTSLMRIPFDADSPHRAELGELITEAIEVETELRAVQAKRTALFARAYELADREGSALTSDLGADVNTDAGALTGATFNASGGPAEPDSARGIATRQERAHRIVRAELAAALRLPEWAVGNDLAYATDTVSHCPTLHAEHAQGHITEKHVRGVIDAGRIIGIRATEQIGTTLTDADGKLLSEPAAIAEITRRYLAFDEQLIPHARTLTSTQLAPVAKRLAEKLAGVSFDDRHRIAKRNRTVTLTELDDGMCSLAAKLTSVEGHAIFDRLTQYAKRLQERDIAAGGARANPSPSARANSSIIGATAMAATAGSVAAAALKRPLSEARADSFVSLLLNGDLAESDKSAKASAGISGKKLGPRVAARIQVIVPVSLTGLLGTRNSGSKDTGAAGGTGHTRDREISSQSLALDGWFQPELVGVGPIDTGTAKRLMHDTATWDMVTVTDGTDITDGACENCSHASRSNTTGDVLGVDGYRIPAAIRRFLNARDPHCRFPGCTHLAYRCDIDHTIAAEAGGPTATNNLAVLCRGHHTMKHHGGFAPTQHDNGLLTWELPSGRLYTSTPPSKVTFNTMLERPDFAALAAKYVKQHPYGQAVWDSPPDAATGPPKPTEPTELPKASAPPD